MMVSNIGTGGKPPEPFRIYAEKYLDEGFSVVPCRGNKLPYVKWKSLQRKCISASGLDNWLSSFPRANIGIITGKISNITVVDIDDHSTSITDLVKRYGETPVIARTPSGGTHLYYRYNGENTATNIFPKTDIRGDGVVVIVPPSYNHITGKSYQFIEGDIWEFKNLPFIKEGSLESHSNKGSRNILLFNYLRKEAFNYTTYQALYERALIYNKEYSRPCLDENEVKRTTKKVWDYKLTGNL